MLRIHVEPKEKQMVSPLAPRHTARKNKHNSSAPSQQVRDTNCRAGLHPGLSLLLFSVFAQHWVKLSKQKCLNLGLSDETHFWPFESCEFCEVDPELL